MSGVVSMEQLQLFPWKKKGLSAPAGMCKVLGGENTPVPTSALIFGVKEEERGFSMLFSPANTVSGGS